MSLITTESVSADKPRRVLLDREGLPPIPARSGHYHGRILSDAHVPSTVRSAAASRILAVDFETRGADTHLTPEIVGLGLSWDRGSCYFPWLELDGESREHLMTLITEHPGTIAHNVYFDGGVMLTNFRRHGRWKACTLALYMYLANEGYPGQKYGLKSVMTELLGWTDSNEEGIDIWLIENGYWEGTASDTISTEDLITRYHTGNTVKPNRGEMWRVPHSILGPYCILDAEATYLLFTEVLEPLLQKFPDLERFFYDEWMRHILIHVDQKILGLHVDRDGLIARKKELETSIAGYLQDILQHPILREHIAAIEKEMLLELAASEPERFLKKRPRPPEPVKHTKNGNVSRNWIKWNENASKYEVQEQSKNWEKWQARYQLALAGENPDYRFNVRSGPQLRKLIYDRLGLPVKVLTDKGEPATSLKAMQSFGDWGQLFIKMNWDEKELSYIQDYIERTEHHPTIHPNVRLPGSKTGRVTSNYPNLFQIPKSKSVMSLFHAPPGEILVDIDHRALESVVAAELSGDPNLLELYGDGKPENDIHLFIAAQTPGLMEPILATGYTPVNPPSGTVDKAKKECKKQRNIAKTVVYSCQFGAGVDTVMAQLEADNVFLERHEVEVIHSSYWKAFSRLKKYSYELRDEARRNGGYVMNGMGRPMCIPEGREHDALSRCIQSTGHDLHTIYVGILMRLLDDAGIPWKPYIMDWHDAVTVSVPEGMEHRTADIMVAAMHRLNERVGGTIKLGGKPTIGKTLAGVKEPEN